MEKHQYILFIFIILLLESYSSILITYQRGLETFNEIDEDFTERNVSCEKNTKISLKIGRYFKFKILSNPSRSTEWKMISYEQDFIKPLDDQLETGIVWIEFKRVQSR